MPLRKKGISAAAGEASDIMKTIRQVITIVLEGHDIIIA